MMRGEEEEDSGEGWELRGGREGEGRREGGAGGRDGEGQGEPSLEGRGGGGGGGVRRGEGRDMSIPLASCLTRVPRVYVDLAFTKQSAPIFLDFPN